MSLKFKHDRRAIMKSSDRAAFYSCALAGKKFFSREKLSRNVNKRENYTNNAWGFGTRLALDLDTRSHAILFDDVIGSFADMTQVCPPQRDEQV